MLDLGLAWRREVGAFVVGGDPIGAFERACRALVTAQAGRQLATGSKAFRKKDGTRSFWRYASGKGSAICGRSCSRASAGCLRSSAGGAVGGRMWWGSSQSSRRYGRYWNIEASEQLHRQSHWRIHHH